MIQECLRRKTTVFHACGISSTYHAIRAVGPRAGRVRVPAVLLQLRVVVALVLLALAWAAAGPQQRLQRLDVADGVAQDVHLGQPLVGVGRGAPLQVLEGVVHLGVG